MRIPKPSQYTYPDSLDGGHYIWDFGDGTPHKPPPTHLYPTITPTSAHIG
ncbi:MAG: hypothetical protein IPN94_08565 [Sphingobacteriales bacterium]|nr:hypothetical protein [Sphingobacteriales bacterium]